MSEEKKSAQELHNEKFPIKHGDHKPQIHHGSLPADEPKFSSEDKAKEE